MKNKEQSIREHNVVIMSRYIDRMFERDNANDEKSLRDCRGEKVYSTDYEEYYIPFYQRLAMYDRHAYYSKGDKTKISELKGIKEGWINCYENYVRACEIYKSLVEREEETARNGGWCRLPEENEK